MNKGKGTHNLYSRKNQKGVKVWYFDGYVNGRRVRKSLETGILKTAKDRRDSILAGRTAHTWGTADIDTPTDEFWKAYLKHAERHKARNTVASDKIKWAQFKDCLKPETLGNVTQADVERFKVHLQDVRKQGPRTINDCLGRLRTIYAFAAEHGYYSGANPFDGVRRFRIEKTPSKFLDKSQLTKFMKAAKVGSPDIHLFCALCVYSGMRTAEATSARWEWFDFKQKIVTIQGDEQGRFTTKSKKFRSVPLSKKLIEILKPYKHAKGYVLLPDKTEQGKWRIRYEPKRAFNTVKKNAEIGWVTPHLLRHTFGSQLAQQGVSLYKIQQWMGHSDPRTTMIYSHLQGHDKDIDKL